MSEIWDVQTWRRASIDILTQVGEGIAAYLPSILATLLILGVGWLVSKAVEIVAGRVLRRMGLDEISNRIGADRALTRAGVQRSASEIAARLLFWTLMLTFLLSAVEALGLEAVTATIDRLIAYLPNVLGAGLIVLLGLLFGRFARGVVASGAAAAGVDQANRIGAAAQGLVVLVVLSVALDQLGVDTRLLITVVSLIIGALAVTLGIAFALGARPVVAHILAGHFLRQSLSVGEGVEIAGRRGVVQRVGAVDTLLSDGERQWSIPNSKLLEEEVTR